jgi:hypothetical protein
MPAQIAEIKWLDARRLVDDFSLQDRQAHAQDTVSGPQQWNETSVDLHPDQQRAL